MIAVDGMIDYYIPLTELFYLAAPSHQFAFICGG